MAMHGTHSAAAGRSAMAAYKRTKKKYPLGEGHRFAAMVNVGEAKGMKNPKAFAAWLGRKKYGKERFQRLAVAGRKKRAKI